MILEFPIRRFKTGAAWGFDAALARVECRAWSEEIFFARLEQDRERVNYLFDKKRAAMERLQKSMAREWMMNQYMGTK